MNTIETCTALDEAIRIIKCARMEVVGGSSVLWAKLFHAEQHLDAQIRHELALETAVQQ